MGRKAEERTERNEEQEKLVAVNVMVET